MLARLKRRLDITGVEKDDLLYDLLEDAQAYILAYTHLKQLPKALSGAACELAATQYNLLGLEGAASHSEGGTSTALDRLPTSLKAQLDSFRVGIVQ